MNIFNKYTSLFILIIGIAAITLFVFLPTFETEEFDQDVIDNIIEGVTTTTLPNNSSQLAENDSESNISEDLPLVISQQEVSKIEKILENNKFESEILDFEAYLLIGSDERSEKIAETRGYVSGKRADVIIVGLVNKENGEITLLSFPRDLLIKNSCTGKIERINASYIKNNCGEELKI